MRHTHILKSRMPARHVQASMTHTHAHAHMQYTMYTHTRTPRIIPMLPRYQCRCRCKCRFNGEVCAWLMFPAAFGRPRALCEAGWRVLQSWAVLASCLLACPFARLASPPAPHVRRGFVLPFAHKPTHTVCPRCSRRLALTCCRAGTTGGRPRASSSPTWTATSHPLLS